MKHKNRSSVAKKPVFFIVAILIFAVTYVAFFGYDSYYGDARNVYFKGASDIRWGIDISGGVEAVFEIDVDKSASISDKNSITDSDMDSAKEIMEIRLLSQNITDSEVFTDYSNKQIIVRFPWESGDTDPTEAVNSLGEMAVLTFYKGKDDSGDIIMQGAADISGANAAYSETNGYVVELKLTEQGASKFAAGTEAQLKDYISIYMDKQLLSSPQVNSVIDDGNAIITGMGSAEAAKELADRINAGALPFSMKATKVNVISPSLGEQALDVMLMAGIVAFAVICLIMILRYRLPGFVACIALIGQVGGMIACVSGVFPNAPSFTLTIPGIAGIILSIGFGVDANVITSERIVEELRNGKTIDGAVSQGFSKAWSSILDGNITNVIVAIVLLAAFGTPDSLLSQAFNFVMPFLGSSVTGTVYSFGYTLLTGVILNFIMGVLASRLMLSSISRFSVFRKPWLYGGAKENA